MENNTTYRRVHTKKQIRQRLADPSVDLDNPVGAKEVSIDYLQERVRHLIKNKEFVINGRQITWEDWRRLIIVPASWSEFVLNALL